MSITINQALPLAGLPLTAVPVALMNPATLLLRLPAQMLMLMLVGLLLRGWRSLPYIGWLVAPVVRRNVCHIK